MSSRAPVTVLTASIPGREALLAKAVESVYAQSHEVEAHLVMAQSTTDGLRGQVHCARQLNHLLPSVTTEWVMRLADDDTLTPDHVERMLPATPTYDVVYSFDTGNEIEHVNCNSWSRADLVKRLEVANFIDGTATWVRTDFLRGVHGYAHWWDGKGFLGAPEANHEDWATWLMLARAGARFHCLPWETFTMGRGDWPQLIKGT